MDGVVADAEGRGLEWDGIDVFPFENGLIARKDVYSAGHRPRVVASYSLREQASRPCHRSAAGRGRAGARGLVELDDAPEGADGIVSLLTTDVDAGLLDRAGPQLRVVANYAVGVNNVDLEEASRRGLVVANTPTS